MRLRMPVSRCCCDEKTFQIGSIGLGIPTIHYGWWDSVNGELDPLQLFAIGANPFFGYGTFTRRVGVMVIQRSLVSGGIPVRTYSNVTFTIATTSVTALGTPDTVDYPSDFHIYCWSVGRNLGDWTVSIPRSELLGPVLWEASGEDWLNVAHHTTPNIASIVNPVINSGSWAPDDYLHLMFDVLTQQPAADPPGRHIFVDGGSSATFEW